MQQAVQLVAETVLDLAETIIAEIRLLVNQIVSAGKILGYLRFQEHQTQEPADSKGGSMCPADRISEQAFVTEKIFALE